jgi:hypothetical protein
MLNKLNSEQEKLMYKHKDEYIDFIINNYKYCGGKKLLLKDIQEDIEWIYSKIKLDKPKFILFADSYFEEKLMINYIFNNGFFNCCLNNQVRDQVWSQVWNQVNDQVWSQVWNQVNDQVWSQVWDQVWNQVNDQVWSQVWNQVNDQVWSQVWSQAKLKKSQKQNSISKLEFIEQYFGIGHESWISFYTYFEKIGILKNDDFNRFSKFILKGIWSIQLFKHWCIITRMPQKVNRDVQNRLHSIDESAIIWNNKQDKNYFIHGVSFSEKLWEKIVTNKITVKEILQINNMEQRNAILSVISSKTLIDKLDAKLISTHKQKKRGKEYMDSDSFKRLTHHEIKLYKIEGSLLNLDEDIYILLYVDPSTTREYFSFVDPKNAQSAVEAMASKFGLTIQEYLSITVES